PHKLTCISADAAKTSEHLQAFTMQYPNTLVCAISNIDQFLSGTPGEIKIPCRTCSRGFSANEDFAKERTILLKDLDAVVTSVAYIYKAIIRKTYGVHGICKL